MTDEKFDGEVRVSFSDDGMLATILIDRERKLNALTLKMLGQLEEVCAQIEQSDARAVLLRTAGQRVFCVGADINHFTGLSAVKMWREWVSAGHRAFDRLAHLRQPTLAVIDGLAFGGGFEIALACDLRIMSDGAEVSLPEAGLGTVPGWGGTERLTELIGRSRTKEMIFTKARIAATEAHNWGITNFTCTADQLESHTNEVVDQLLSSAPIALQLSKQIIDAAADGSPSSVLEALASGVAAATDDLAEGTTAFAEKRVPEFKNL